MSGGLSCVYAANLSMFRTTRWGGEAGGEWATHRTAALHRRQHDPTGTADCDGLEIRPLDDWASSAPDPRKQWIVGLLTHRPPTGRTYAPRPRTQAPRHPGTQPTHLFFPALFFSLLFFSGVMNNPQILFLVQD
jgi:hypothetical protein